MAKKTDKQIAAAAKKAAAKKAAKKVAKKVVPKAAKPAATKERKPAEDKGGLTIEHVDKDSDHKSAKIQPGQRLYLNAAKDTLYPEGHEKAASLYCTEHKFVPRKEFEGLKKGK